MNTPKGVLDIPTLTPHLVPENMWYFGKSKRQDISPSVMDRIHAERLTKYLTNRDALRFARAKLPEKWGMYILPLTGKLWKLDSPLAKNLKYRLIFLTNTIRMETGLRRTRMWL